jgi:bifunctional UDP-N-acetylglucosamine pyrophosphorylase/glucosamine-1-phosphate N-acetyltransferase
MLELHGKPMVDYTVNTLLKSGLSSKQIVLVVGYCKEKVQEYFADKVSFAIQKELKGTAHAAYTGMQALPPEIEDVLVMGGDDSAFYRPETLQKLINKHKESGAVVTLLSVNIENPDMYGRVVRHGDGKIEIIEKEYVSGEQKNIHEVSTGTFCFKRKWFENMYPTMPVMRKLQEFVLPTAWAVARLEGSVQQVVTLEDSQEWFGVNTPDELFEARRRKSLNN